MGKSVNVKKDKAVESLVQYQQRDQISSLTLNDSSGLLDLTMDSARNVTINVDSSKLSSNKTSFLFWRSRENITKTASTSENDYMVIPCNIIYHPDGNIFKYDSLTYKTSIETDANGEIPDYWVRIGGQVMVSTLSAANSTNYLGDIKVELVAGRHISVATKTIELTSTSIIKTYTLTIAPFVTQLKTAYNEMYLSITGPALTILAGTLDESTTASSLDIPRKTYMSGEVWRS